jgi:hypothetical protein
MSPSTVIGVDAPQGWAVLNFSTGKPLYVASGKLELVDAPVEFDALLETYRPDLVAFERVEKVYERDGFGPKMAGNLYRSGWIGGTLEGWSRAKGYRTTIVEAPDVRKSMGIRAPKGKADAAVYAVLRMRCPSWPAPRKSSVHARDAALAAIYAEQRERLFGAGLPRREAFLEVAQRAGPLPTSMLAAASLRAPGRRRR